MNNFSHVRKIIAVSILGVVINLSCMEPQDDKEEYKKKGGRISNFFLGHLTSSSSKTKITRVSSDSSDQLDVLQETVKRVPSNPDKMKQLVKEETNSPRRRSNTVDYSISKAKLREFQEQKKEQDPSKVGRRFSVWDKISPFSKKSNDDNADNDEDEDDDPTQNILDFYCKKVIDPSQLDLLEKLGYRQKEAVKDYIEALEEDDLANFFNNPLDEDGNTFLMWSVRIMGAHQQLINKHGKIMKQLEKEMLKHKEGSEKYTKASDKYNQSKNRCEKHKKRYQESGTIVAIFLRPPYVSHIQFDKTTYKEGEDLSAIADSCGLSEWNCIFRPLASMASSPVYRAQTKQQKNQTLRNQIRKSIRSSKKLSSEPILEEEFGNNE